MKKIVFLIILCIFCTSYAVADEQTDVDYFIDLIHQNQYTQADYDKYLASEGDLYYSKALELFLHANLKLQNYDYEHAYESLESALSFADGDNRKLMAEITYYLAELDILFDDINRASTRSIELRDMAESINYYDRVIEANFNIAFVYIYNYDYDTGIKFAEEAFDLSRQHDYEKGFIEYYIFLYYLSYYEYEYDEANELLITALESLASNNYFTVGESLKVSILRSLSYMNINYHDVDMGHKYLLELEEAIDSKSLYHNYLLNEYYGLYYYDVVEDNEKAREYLLKALESYQAASIIPNAYPRDIDLYYTLGDVFKNLGLFEESSSYFSKAVNYDYDYETYDSEYEDVLSTLDDVKHESLIDKMSLMEELNLLNEEKIKLSRGLMYVLVIGILILLFTVIVIVFEIKSKTLAQKELYLASITDGLTSLYNRSKIIEILSTSLKPDNAVILLDVDNFKEINDTHGHIVGDEVLIKVSELIKESVRDNDKVGRYGGEEFLLCLEDISKEELLEVAERIRNMIESYSWSYENLKTTVSIGLTTCFSVDPEEVLHEADQLMYQAKKSGKNKIAFN